VWRVLEETQLLKSEGYIVAPFNIAHGAIRLALLQRFEYTELGILDNTHLDFLHAKQLQLFERSITYCVIDSSYQF